MVYSGLLEASQHVATSLGDPAKANEICDSKEEDLSSDKIITLLDKITNLANKRPS